MLYVIKIIDLIRYFEVKRHKSIYNVALDTLFYKLRLTKVNHFGDKSVSKNYVGRNTNE